MKWLASVNDPILETTQRNGGEAASLNGWGLARASLWLSLLLIATVGAWAVTATHRNRSRGIADGFPAPIGGADVPILGVNVPLDEYDDRELGVVLDRMADDGFVWVRHSFPWSQIEREPGDFDWTGPDRVIEALSQRSRLKLIAVLEDDPPSPPEDPARFAAFARRFAARYGHAVAAYQIWDEPNLAANWGGGPVSPPSYADLLARSSAAIRSADPDALILLAGLAPTTETGPQNLSEARYLEQLYRAGAAASFDVVVAKAYGFDTGPSDRRVDESILNLSRLLLLREVMVAHGDRDKAIWTSHWGWNALPAGWIGAPSIWGQTDAATQAAWTVATLERARREWPWMGGMVIENLQAAGPRRMTEGSGPTDPRWGFSLLEPDGSPRPVYTAVTEWVNALPDAAPVGGYPVENRWATYEGSWLLGPLGADPGPGAAGGPGLDAELPEPGDRATFRFDGTAVALTVRRGPYLGYLTVTVDGEPANSLPLDEQGRAYLVLFDTEPGVATVALAQGLNPGVHTVEVAIAGGGGQWPLVDWRVGGPPVSGGLGWRLVGLGLAALVSGALLVREALRIDWHAGARAFLSWPDRRQRAAVVGCAAFLWWAAALSWGRPLFESGSSAAGLVVSGTALPLLALLLALRPDVGLVLIALSAPLYLVPARMFYGALALPELLVLACCAGYGISRWVGLPGATDRPGCPSGSDGQGRGDDGAGLLRSVRHRLTMSDWAVGLLLLAAVAAGAAAHDRAAALFELRAVFLFPALTYALLRLDPPGERLTRRIGDGLVLGGLCVALVGLGQVALRQGLVIAEGGLPRLTSVYQSPNSVALYLGRVWPLLAAVAILGRGGRRRWYAIALVPVTAALALSFSRGTLLLGLPAAVLVMGWLAGGRFRWLALSVVLVGAVALVPLLRLPRFGALFDLGEGTTFFRLQLWRSSLRMIREQPLVGVGPGNFAAAYRSRYVLPSAWREFNLDHPHNIMLDLWTRLGVVGLLAGALAQAAFWRGARQRWAADPLMLGLAGGMAALLAHGLVDNAVFAPDLALTFFLMLALGVGSLLALRSRKPRSGSSPN